MFRLYRKTICSRWHSKYKKSLEKKSQNVHPKSSVLFINTEKQDHSNNNQKKQHANKQDKRYWDDPHFHFHFFRASLFETAGWLGTVTVCFNYHLKHISNVIEYERGHSSCLFSNIVLALPRRHVQKELTQSSVPLTEYTGNERLDSSVSLPSLLNVNEETSPISSSSFSTKTLYTSQKGKVSEVSDILVDSIKVLTEKYSVAVENLVGVKNINKNDKKAFRSFQNAARNGSSTGFYNLGLCYQLGKGTKTNLNMAAYCYRRAAMKGHGLASYNLAIFFYKGIGGLPVDTKIAKELLAEAAEKDVPEAQLYFGILFLEEKKWSDAVRIFSDLVEKNIPDAQYYLALCYENGLGVQRNNKVASELFKKSAEQGNRRAADKLKIKEKSCGDSPQSFSNTDQCKIAESNSLHPSVSVPELRTVAKNTNQNLLKLSILSYLDLFSPLLIVNNANKIKNSFQNDEKLAKDCSSTYLSFKPLPAVVMEVKTQL